MKKAQQGFSLIELLIAISLAAILSAIAVPSISETLKSNRLTARTNDIGAVLNTARQYAITRNSVVLVCHSNDAEVASPSCNGGTSSSWGTGAIIYAPPIFSSSISNRAYSSSTDELVRKVRHGEAKGISVTATNADNYIAFSPEGFLSDSSSVTLEICDDRTGETGRTITISTSGRYSVTSTTCA